MQTVAAGWGVGTARGYDTLTLARLWGRWDGVLVGEVYAAIFVRAGSGICSWSAAAGRIRRRRAVLIVNVEIRVKSGMRNAFVRETYANVEQSRKEPGIFAFDLLVDPADDHHFLLVEGYRTEQAPAAHKQTPHYAVWRETVEPMMAVPRVSTKWGTLDSRG